MFKRYVVDFLISLIFRKWRRNVVFNAKVSGVKVYLKFLRGLRLSIFAALGLFVVLQVAVFGLVIMVGAGVWLVPLEAEIKAYLLLGIGASFFFIPMGLAVWLLSERV